MILTKETYIGKCPGCGRELYGIDIKIEYTVFKFPIKPETNYRCGHCDCDIERTIKEKEKEKENMDKDLERKLKKLTKDEQKIFTELLEKMDGEDRIFIPKYGETYWTIDDYDDVVLVEWQESKRDEVRLRKNIVFRTEKEALFEREKRRVKDELNMYARKHNDSDEEKWENIAKCAIEEIGRDRIKKYLFGAEG